VRRIPVTIRDLTYWADVDDEDFDFLSQFRWTADVKPTVTYTNTNVETASGSITSTATA